MASSRGSPGGKGFCPHRRAASAIRVGESPDIVIICVAVRRVSPAVKNVLVGIGVVDSEMGYAIPIRVAGTHLNPVGCAPEAVGVLQNPGVIETRVAPEYNQLIGGGVIKGAVFNGRSASRWPTGRCQLCPIRGSTSAVGIG